MLLVDKTNSQIRLLVTVSEATNVASPSYILHVYSPYTKQSFSLGLPGNSSPHPARYDEFILPVTAFNGIGAGVYHYSITEEIDGKLERGVMKVVEAESDGYESIIPEESVDDFLVYNPE